MKSQKRLFAFLPIVFLFLLIICQLSSPLIASHTGIEIKNKGLSVNSSVLTIHAKGSQAGGVFAHFKVFVNEQEVGEAYTSSTYQVYQYNLSIDSNLIEHVQITFDNDAVINGQDRNLYVQSIELAGQVIEATAANVTFKRNNGDIIPYNGVMGWEGDLIFDIEVKISPIPYTYTSFNGDVYDMFLWEGDNIVMLTQSEKLDGNIMKDLVAIHDKAYDFYFSATGRKPNLLFNYNGKTTIAEVDNTCGAGCGYLGQTGIEILGYYFNHLYETYKNEGKYDQIVFYELGRNFWYYGNQIEYKSPDSTGRITTGYAVFMRDISYEALNIPAADFSDMPFEEFTAVVEGLIDIYLADPSYTWENTLRVGKAPPNPTINGLQGESLFTSFLYRLKRDYGGLEFVNKIWKEIEKRPDAISTQDAVDNFILASCAAANKNLTGLFTEWRWPISQSAIDEANTKFGSTGLIVNAKGTQAGGEYAHFKLYVNEQEVGEATTNSSYKNYLFDVSSITDDINTVKIAFDNDAVINGEDRNLYVNSITVGDKKIEAIAENVTYRRTDGSIIPYNYVMGFAGDLIFEVGPVSTICEGDVNLSSQAEVDAFSCTEVSGSLTIKGDDIGHLEGLSQLIHVGEDLKIIDNPILNDLSGLNNLQTIGEWLEISRNQQLKYIDGLNDLNDLNGMNIIENLNLKSITGLNGDIEDTELVISRNDALDTISGFNGLLKANDYLAINANPSLKTISGFKKLNTTFIIDIIGNVELHSITGFEGLTRVSESILIQDNSSLEILFPNTQLNFSAEYTNIKNNDKLKSIDFLNYYKDAISLEITGNQSLENIDALSNLLESYIWLKVADNPNLNSCCGLYNLLTFGELQGTLILENNGSNCTEADIIANGPCKQETTLFVNAKGTQAGEESAHFKVYVNDQEVGDTYTTSSYQTYRFGLSIDSSKIEQVKITFDNDALINGQDRNLYVESIEIGQKEIAAIDKNVTYRRTDGSIIPYNGVMGWAGDLIFEIEPDVINCNSDVKLTSQAKVDAFNCKTIKGSLTISGQDITNLDGLSGLDTIWNQLSIIDNPLLTNLDSLQIQGGISDLLISNNSQLKDISALNNISVGFSLSIEKNPSLKELNGLQHLTGIRTINISDNDSLKNLNGLASLKNVRDISISRNASLENINGLSMLTSVEYGGVISSNPNLTKFCGLYALIATGNRSVVITNNAKNPTYEDILANGRCVQENGLIVNAKGSQAGGEFAHFKVYVNDQEIGETTTTSFYKDYAFDVSAITGNINTVKINFYNDAVINGADRNLYVRSITIVDKKIEAIAENVTYRRTNGNIIPYNYVMGWAGDLIFEIKPEPIVCEGDITLTTQAEVDAFSCTEVTGSLTISGNDIINLDGLSSLLFIRQGLSIINNPLLANLKGLNALKDCDFLTIEGNPLLRDLSALSALEEVWSLAITDNISLESIKGLGTLKVNGILFIKGNDELIEIDGLDVTSNFDTEIIISENEKLTSLGRFTSLEAANRIMISNNAVLVNLDFLSSLQYVLQIEISENGSLQNIDGLRKLTDVPASLSLANNINLSSCCGLYPLLSGSGTIGDINISGNGTECTEADIIANGPCDQEATLIVNVKGSQAGGEFAHYKLYVNDQIVGDTYTTSTYESYQYSGLPYNISNINMVKITFDNDAVINGQDRNLYVESIEIEKKEITASEENVTYRRKDSSVIPYNGVMGWDGDLIFSELMLIDNTAFRRGKLSGNTSVNKDVSQEIVFDVYPNPSNSRFNISLDNIDYELLQLEIFDQIGKNVYNQYVENIDDPVIEIDLSLLKNGIYYLKLNSDQHIITRKIIKY